MADKLLIAVMGHRDSGKSTTWNTLFGRTVKRKMPMTLRQLAREFYEGIA
jgi:ABC-type multidrug transport system ATPase subunit